MRHLFNVLAHACVAALLVVLLGLGVQLHASLFAGIGLAVAVATLTLLPGVFTLVGVRMWFNLVSAGRVAEILTFGVLGSVFFKLATLVFPQALSITTCAFEAGFATALLVVPLAFLTGNLKGITRRSWLPVRMKSDPQ
ncbi:MAG TPA: hypothetical protein V6C81_12290 [Planktothrix sp.]